MIFIENDFAKFLAKFRNLFIQMASTDLDREENLLPSMHKK